MLGYSCRKPRSVKFPYIHSLLRVSPRFVLYYFVLSFLLSSISTKFSRYRLLIFGQRDWCCFCVWIQEPDVDEGVLDIDQNREPAAALFDLSDLLSTNPSRDRGQLWSTSVREISPLPRIRWHASSWIDPDFPLLHQEEVLQLFARDEIWFAVLYLYFNLHSRFPPTTTTFQKGTIK